MKKIKVSPNLLALLLLMALFIGWEYMIIVTAFIWCFCESSQSLKNLTIKAIAVYAGCYLFSLFWSLFTNGYDLGVSALGGLLEIFASFGLDITELTLNLNKYILNPASVIIELLSSAVSFLIIIAKFKFVVSVITNKPMPNVFGKIQEFINNFLNFATSNIFEEQPTNYQQPAQQPMPQQQMFNQQQ